MIKKLFTKEVKEWAERNGKTSEHLREWAEKNGDAAESEKEKKSVRETQPLISIV